MTESPCRPGVSREWFEVVGVEAMPDGLPFTERFCNPGVNNV